ncbi:hypothetical protein [Solibacillus cecembensis]|uniref:hypothetical protein n=1 Tax=Solibacillus cecembensis TaxID=459347 RepID=UPI003D083C8E
MSVLLIFLPILIMGVLIIGVKKLASKVRIWTPKRTSWVMIIYFMLGVISFIGILIMPDKTMKVLSEQQLKVALAEEKKLDELYWADKFDQIPADYFVFANSYEGTAEDIEITLADNSYNTRVAVTWNDSKSNNIVATYYEMPIIYNRIDISKDLEPPTIEFKDNHFYISEVEKKVEFYTIQAKLEMLEPINMGYMQYGEFDRFIGNRILHLNVPKHFNIIDNSGRVD